MQWQDFLILLNNQKNLNTQKMHEILDLKMVRIWLMKMRRNLAAWQEK